MNHYAFVSLDRSQNHLCNVYLKRFINWSDINHNSIQRLRNKPDVSPKFFYHNIFLFCALKLNRLFLSDVNYLDPVTLPTIIVTVLGLLVLFILFGTLMYVLPILSLFPVLTRKTKF